MPSANRPVATPAMDAQPPRKRARLASNAKFSIATREMNKDDHATSLEVDYLILDFLLYEAVEACLANPHTSWDDQVGSVERNLLQVDEFYNLFRKRYPNHQLDREISFRRDLLQFAALFTQRFRRNCTTPSLASLERLRASNRQRTYQWIDDASGQPTANADCSALDSKFPLPQDDLNFYRAMVLRQLGVPLQDEAYEEAFYGTHDSTSLLDVLPLFMKVSAACFGIFDVAVTSQWASMAASLMSQAALEQYLVYGEDGSDAIDEAFAWGYKDNQEENKINDMFKDDGHARETPLWSNRKDKMLRRLLSWEDDVPAHFRRLLNEQSILDCEKSVLAFIGDVSRGVAKPVLIQLQEGCLDGMTVEETRSFIDQCGLNLTDFLTPETVMMRCNSEQRPIAG